MLFEYARLTPNATGGQSVLILGAAGNVGAYAVQLANLAGLRVIATASQKDGAFLTTLGADQILAKEGRSAILADASQRSAVANLAPVDSVLDLVGGATRERSLSFLKPSGNLVTVVSPRPDDLIARHPNQKIIFFLADVTTARLNHLSSLFDSGQLRPQVGIVLPLDQAKEAREMLAGKIPDPRGKIVLTISSSEPS
jgi:NADPH:quinone reductase-like Zn-dependent oxidoreductase